MKKFFKRIFVTLIAVFALCVAFKAGSFATPHNIPISLPVSEIKAMTNETAGNTKTGSEQNIFVQLTKTAGISKKLTVDTITPSEYQAHTTEISELNGVIGDIHDFTEYVFIPRNDGIHSFWFDSVTNDAHFSVEVSNYDHEQIAFIQDITQDGGVYLEMKPGSTYHIRVSYFAGTGAYTLKAGIAKPITDISAFTSISDDVGYHFQQNGYLYTPKTTGSHRFELYASDSTFEVSICDSEMNLIEKASDLGDDRTLDVILEGGKQYSIQVSQQSGLGAYTLNIDAPKPTVDISDYSEVMDSFQYTEQKNLYKVVPTTAVSYQIYFSDFKDDVAFEVTVYDKNMNEVDTRVFKSVDDEGFIGCPDGNEFYVEIASSSADTEYTLHLTESAVS